MIVIWRGALEAWEQDDLDQAVESSRRLVEARPDAPWFRYLYGSVLQEEGNFEAAEPHLEAAVEARPDLWQAHARLLAGALQANKLDAASQHLTQIPLSVREDAVGVKALEEWVERARRGEEVTVDFEGLVRNLRYRPEDIPPPGDPPPVDSPPPPVTPPWTDPPPPPPPASAATGVEDDESGDGG